MFPWASLTVPTTGGEGGGGRGGRAGGGRGEEKEKTQLQALVYDEGAGKRCSECGRRQDGGAKLQALVYDILPSGKRCSECGGRCRKTMIGVWRKMPESDDRSVEEDAGKR